VIGPDTQVNVAIGPQAGFGIQPGRRPALADNGFYASVAEHAEHLLEMLLMVSSLVRVKPVPFAE
jgi:hypothetical protein